MNGLQPGGFRQLETKFLRLRTPAMIGSRWAAGPNTGSLTS
jgi:hypothetical protein